MKILCPNHKDNTPSLHVYKEYSHCFVCGFRIKNTGESYVTQIKEEPEEIKSKIRIIQNLPVERVRGLDLHTDEQSYYILWPDFHFYKQRNYIGEQRYMGPKGIRPPLFLYPEETDHIVAIEGELNCISVWYSHTNVQFNHTLCSPGAASNFTKYVDFFLKYKKITLILDHDPAGVAYGSETKERLLKLCKHVNLVTVDTDYNDILQNSGYSVVLNKFRKDVGDAG